MHASEIVELVVQCAQFVTQVAVEAPKYSTPEATINLEGQSAPHYEIKSPGFGQKARKTFEKYKKRDRAHMVELTTEDEISEISISRSNRFKDDYDDIASLL
ncbi:hypothetical protein OnM2_040044 [Erysiphe neolycopersici]|uniref:Uncharacterized protein n=1 Tax=Erysiphe neolycopersici TaxID=212602 RepID=A0A420HVU4_9PEZI|nr:hypothetical protein OnM2_040044 [Erysiphe neolycopersici]